MKRERADPDAERAPRIVGAAPGDIEALRASDRLQRIFQSDMAQGRRRAGAADGSRAPRPAEAQTGDVEGAAASDGRSFFSSRRTRVLVGLSPVYLAMAVLALEGFRTLRDQPKHVAFVAADGPARHALEAEPPDALGADPVAEKRAEPGTAGDAHAGTGAARLGGEDPSGALWGPERSAIPVPRPAESVAAQLEGTPRGKASGDVAKTGHRVATERADRSLVAGSDVEREALEASATRAATPPARRPEAGTTTGESASRATSGGVEGRVSAPGGDEPGQAAKRVAERDASVSAGPERVAGERERSMRGAAEQARPDAAAIEPPQDTSVTVPQATWSPGEAAAPVPLPAARFARLSEMLAERGAAEDEADEPPSLARPTPRGAPEPAGPQRKAHAAASVDPPSDGSVLQSGSAPPRIVVHYRRGAGLAAARRVVSELLARGYARTELRPVPFAISRANVRYFHDQNRPVARTVNTLVEATGRRSSLRDFTHYAPLPAVGTVEVWLPG